MENSWILAQIEQIEGQSEVSSEPVGQETRTTAVADSNAPPSAAPTRGPQGYYQLVFIGVIILIMYFLVFREPKRKQKQHQKMVQSLKKNDKVRTIGGVLGTVVDIRGDEIVLKVDESNNTKIRIVSSAIGKNLSNEGT